MTLAYTISAAIVQPIADSKIVKLLEEFAGVYKLLLAIISGISVMLMVGITIVIKVSNTGIMYR